MSRTARSLARPSSWPLCANPRLFVAAVVLVDLAMVGVVSAVALTQSPGLHEVGLAALLTGVALAFEELVTHTSRLQLRLSAELKRDMTSVWAIAAAVALTQAGIVFLLAAIFGYTWVRQQRPAGEAAYRKLFNFSNVLLSCLSAGWVAHTVADRLSGDPRAVVAIAEVCAAIIGYTIVNRALVTAPFWILGIRGKALIGTGEENLIELATLCLGGLVAVAVLDQPLLALLALAPMVSIQRGAVMRTLESAATTDAKTGLLNAVAWEEVASRELARAARAGDDVAVLIVDIDHFKRVNDRHGHLAGDRVLRLIGKTLAAEVRDYDTVARFGGEEFVAVLPSAPISDALVVAERLRSRIHDLPMSGILSAADPALDERVSVSIGVAIAPSDGVELSDLLHAADSALYVAKATGRNRVALADRPDSGGVEMLHLT